MSAPSHDVSCLVLPIFICFVVATQDCAKRVADADLEKRTQAEKDAQQKKQLSKERDAALVAVNGVYLCDRASHKAVANSINSATEVEKHARLVHGAVREVARVAARAVAAAPADQRAECTSCGPGSGGGGLDSGSGTGWPLSGGTARDRRVRWGRCC